MEKQYTILKKLGQGTFGYVWKAIQVGSNDIVAIKQLKENANFPSKDYLYLKEVEALKTLKYHPNIIQLKDVFIYSNQFFYVFEYMEENLYERIKRKKPWYEEIRFWMHQILKGVEFMHQNNYFHRDLKPENILISENRVKLADFGLARKLTSLPNYIKKNEGPHGWDFIDPFATFTDYVCTRWYRAPEVILRMQPYTTAIDIWAVGLIMAELLKCAPLFPGASEVEELNMFCSMLGPPNDQIWLEGFQKLRSLGFHFPNQPKLFEPFVNLSRAIPNASSAALDLVLSMCAWDPKKRLTASEALKHPFFQYTEQIH